MPVEENEFYPLILDWVKNDKEGKRYRRYFIKDKLVYVRFYATINTTYNAPSKDK